MFRSHSATKAILSNVFVLALLLISADGQSKKPAKPRPKATPVASPPAKDVLFDELDEIINSLNFGWRWLSNGTTSNELYDRSRITKPRRGFVRVWMQTQNDPPQMWVAKTMSYYELHCAETKIRTLSSTDYGKDGRVLRSASEVDSKWRFIVPDSIAEELWRVLCKGAKDLEDRYRGIASEYYAKGFKAESKGDYKDALENYETATRFLLGENEKLNTAIARIKVKLRSR